MVGLSKWADKFGHELSGGMQQRVGLARAFATDADILLMDEPFSALDPLIRDKLQDELLMLQKELKKTIIFVSHDLDEALKIGNRIAILEGGRIVQCGAAEDILLRPANDYVAEFVKHMNPLNVLRGALADDAGRGPHARPMARCISTAAGRVRLTLDAEGRPIGVTLDGDAGRLASADGETGWRRPPRATSSSRRPTSRCARPSSCAAPPATRSSSSTSSDAWRACAATTRSTARSAAARARRRLIRPARPSAKCGRTGRHPVSARGRCRDRTIRDRPFAPASARHAAAGARGSPPPRRRASASSRPR